MRQEILYDWDNLTIVPAILSDIYSRKEINILNSDNKLPLFIAPMDMVVDKNNSKLFKDLGFEVCLPRGENDKSEDSFISYSLSEIIELSNLNVELPKRVLIDIANAHMRLLYDTVKQFKINYPAIELMIGNIANPETYKVYADLGVDCIRVGIGGGSGCFIENTIINTSKGDKKISEIINGDLVKTHLGNYKKVINLISYKTSDPLIKINNNTSTLDHEYYVINKNNINNITDDNIHKYAYWLEAESLDESLHYIIECME